MMQFCQALFMICNISSSLILSAYAQHDVSLVGWLPLLNFLAKIVHCICLCDGCETLAGDACLIIDKSFMRPIFPLPVYCL